MKKIIFVLLSMILIFTLTACDEDSTLPSGITLPTNITTTDEPTTNEPTTQEPTTQEPTNTITETYGPTTTEEPTTEIREIIISFDSQGGSTFNDLSVLENTDHYDLNLPTPERDGYTFDGWYDSLTFENEFVFDSSLDNFVTIYAKWTPIPYDINYYESVGSEIVDVFDPNYALFIKTDQGDIFGAGQVYLKSGMIFWDEFEKINEYFPLHEDESIENISGNWQLFALTSESRVFAWGANQYGVLGNNSTATSNDPIDITDNFNLNEGETIVYIDGFFNNSVALTSHGRLFLWGDNFYGQIGDDTFNDHHLPYDITPRLYLEEDEYVIDVNMGLVHTIVLTNKNRVFTWGYGNHGQLGLGYQAGMITLPVPINDYINLSTDEYIIKIEASEYGSFALSNLGKLFVFGLDESGHFGVGEADPVDLPKNISPQLNIPEGDLIVDVVANRDSVYLFTEDDKIFVFGMNYDNMLMVGTDIFSIKVATDISDSIEYDYEKILFNEDRTILLTEDNKVYGIGSNNSGEFGTGDFNVKNELYQIQIPSTNANLLHHQTVNYNSIIFKYIPFRTGYTFDDWYTDTELTQRFTLTKMPNENLNLYAKWMINEYTISFEENGGSDVEDITDDYLSAVTKPEDPLRDGYVFDGWYTDSALTDDYSFDTMPAEDITLYAKWIALTALISFDIDDVEINDLISYTGDAFTMPSPTTEGKTFAGWYLEPDFITEVNWTHIPAGSNTIYGKWDINTYTITYESNGGSLIGIETYDYEEVLIEPTAPTKTDMVFVGWFLDSSFVEEFSFTTMPAENITLYAKWADATNPYLIINQINQPSGSIVTVQGVIYDFFEPDQTGIFIFDETGQITIDTTNLNVSIGDKIQVQGTLGITNGIATIHTVTDITILSSDNDLPTPIALDLGDIDDLTIVDLFKVYQTQALIMSDDSSQDIVIFDPVSLKYLVINSDTYTELQALELATHLADRITITYTIVPINGRYEISIIDYTIMPLSLETKANILHSMIELHIDLHFLPGDHLPIDELNMLNLGTLDVSILPDFNQYYDDTNHVFLETDEEVTLPLSVTYTLNGDSTTFTLLVTLEPVVLSTIEEVINDQTMSYHTIEVLVIAKTEMDMLLRDDTGYLYAYNLPFIQVGDIIQLIVRNDRDYPMTYLDYNDGDLVLHRIISKENELNLIPNQLSNTDFLALDPSDLSIYGEYVELRGFIKEYITGDYYEYGFNLTNDDYTIEIMTMNHSGFEKMFEYMDLEVFIRGYLYTNEDGEIQLLYEGIRQDIRLPEYTDQERVDILIKIFNDVYSGETYDAFENFPMFPYHPMLGGEITWAFSDPNFDLYDFENGHFLYSYTDQAFTMNITITSGNVSETIAYTSQLNKITLSEFSDFEDIGYYEPIFVEGLVIYRNYDFVYIMNDLGEIVLVDIDGLDVLVGDEVLLYVEIYRSYSYVDGMMYLRGTYIVDPVIEYISRQNPINIPATVMEIPDILDLQNTAELNHKIYVQVDGIIDVINNIYVIQTPDGYIVLSFVDPQTKFEIMAYEGQYVNLKGYILGEDYMSGLGQYAWEMMIVGEPNDIEVIDLSVLEKFDFIEAYIKEHYQITIEGDTTIDFSNPDYYFSDLIIDYTTLNDSNNLFNFAYGRSQYIDEVLTSTTITIQVDLAIDTENYSFTFDITILPTEETTITAIEDVITDGSTVQNIDGTVIMLNQLEQDKYLFLIEDETGIIYVTLSRDLFRSDSNYAYYHNYMNDNIIISGTITEVNGKLMMIASNLQLIEESISINPTFTSISLEDYLALDMTDPANYGVAYEISGMVYDEYGDYGREYYLTDGENTIRLLAQKLGYIQLVGYKGFEVVVKVFSYDVDHYGNRAAMYADFTYTSGESIRFGEYTIDEQLELIKQSIINSYMSYNRFYYPGDYISLPNPNGRLVTAFDATITEEIVEGNDYLFDNGSSYNALHALSDQEIIVKTTITIGEESLEFYYTIYLNGFEINTLDDLFSMDPGTPEIALEATVIHSSYDMHYLLIEDKVYTLNTFSYGYFSAGDKIIILGLKTIIDGIPDYTYDIQLLNDMDYEVLDITPIVTTIDELYTNDYDTNPINLSLNRVYGLLGYDEYLELYTLTDNNSRIYINMYYAGWSYEDYLKPYLGEYVYVDVFLPMETIRNDYIIVDMVENVSSISVENYTPELSVQIIQDRLAEFSTLDVYSGEYLDDYLVNEYPYHPYTSIVYTLVDPLDEAYIDIDNMIINNVDTLQSFEILATITYLNTSTEVEYEDTIQLTIQVHPRLTSTIEDVLYGIDGDIYQVQGVIVALGPIVNDYYSYAIIDDGQNRIYVELGDYSDMTFNPANLDLALNDEILIIAKRDYYDDTYMVPKLSVPSVIEVVASNVTITNTPIQMTIEEIMSLSHTDPTLYYQYVEVTDLFIYNYTTYNPSYYLESDIAIANTSNMYYKLYIETINTQSIHDTLTLIHNQEVKITGYLMGYQTLNGYGEWRLIYESHELITE